jgi:hypothetical protein
VEQPMTPSNGMPDAFDRLLSALHDLPDVTRTKAATVRVIPPLGVGGTQMFVVQTLRQRERGDTIFLEVVGTELVRVVIPAQVADVIARQRDVLTAKSRSRAAKAAADDRKARGLQPGFMKAKRKR